MRGRVAMLPALVVAASSSSAFAAGFGNGSRHEPTIDFVGSGAGLPATAVVGANVRAGVGVVDMTPDVGYCAGQYCDVNTSNLDGLAGGEIDPFATHKTKSPSYGVQSRLTARAIVVEGGNGKRIALLKTDNYLAQDTLLRRVGQILDEHGTSGIAYDQILHHVTHDHSAAYSSTPAWGVWIFEDVFDARFFENQARKMAEAIELAAAHLKPARMGATTVRHNIFKGNVTGLAKADDGTPAGYPLEYGDHGLVVMRFDDVSGPEPKPLAVWINWGEHPEGLDGYDLHSADFLGPLERFVDRELGAPLVFSQGDVGGAERSGNPNQMLDDMGAACGRWPGNVDAPAENNCGPGQGVIRDWNHKGYVQTERNVRYLADAVIRGWQQIGNGEAQVPFSSDFAVDFVSAWVPGPLSHPYPSVSNCRTQTTAEGDTGVPILGLPQCERIGPGDNPVSAKLAMILATANAEGAPVPDQYDAPAFTGVEENLRLRLQTFRLGDVLLASCACEAQADLILNLESRTDAVTGNIYDGFDWACLMPEFAGDPQYADACARQAQIYDPGVFPSAVPGTDFSPQAIAHLRAQVHNDAAGWDAPENAAVANTEAAEISRIKGNFTKQEIQDLGAPGYRLVVGIGHAGDYNGYTVSYREYQNRDHYRKALTAYGPHTADYMVTRLVRMAASMQGGQGLETEITAPVAIADEARQQAQAVAMGGTTSAAYDAWRAALPSDIGPAKIIGQPSSIERFSAATFTWRGGNTAIDNPAVRVERRIDGRWRPFADQTGEVQTKVQWPQGLPGVIQTYAGQQEWLWTANFEAYSAFPARLGSTPPGAYRFVADGRIRQHQDTAPYHLESDPFTVSPWTGLEIHAARGSGSLSFDVLTTYPRSYEDTSLFRFIRDDGRLRLCKTCTFRPWARRGAFDRAEVVVTLPNGNTRPRTPTCSVNADGSAHCSVNGIGAHDTARVTVFDTDSNTGTLEIQP